MPLSPEEQVEVLLATADKHIVRIGAAFVQALVEIQENLFDTSSVESFLSMGDIERALMASGVDELENLLYGAGLGAKSYVFANEIYNAYQDGVKAAVSLLTGEMQKTFAFDSLNSRAIENLKLSGANTVKEISVATKQGLRTALQEHVKTYANPNKAAKDVRQLIGLTDAQMKAVLNFRRQLEEKRIFGLTNPADRRLNAIDQSIISRHMREGHLDQNKIDELVYRYYKSMLNKRASDIARTEAANAVHNAQQELWIQGIEQGLFDEQTDRKFWIVTPDDRLRATHAAIPLMNPYGVAITHSFITPFGPVMTPGDSNVNLINCRCGVILAKVGTTYNDKGGLKYV